MGEEAMDVSVNEDVLEELAKTKPTWIENIKMEKKWQSMENNCIIRRRKVVKLENDCKRLGGPEMLNLGIFFKSGNNKLLKLQCECKMRRKSLRRDRLRFLQSFKREHLKKAKTVPLPVVQHDDFDDDDDSDDDENSDDNDDSDNEDDSDDDDDSDSDDDSIDDSDDDDAIEYKDLRRRQSQVEDFATVSFMLQCNNISAFIQEVLKISRNIKIKELKTELAAIPPDGIESIQKFEREIEAVNTMELTEVALPIDKEYDWEAIMESLNEKNVSARDYQILWKFALHPSINKEDWLAIETEKLKQVVSSCRFNWDDVARELNTGRTSYQCFNHYALN